MDIEMLTKRFFFSLVAQNFKIDIDVLSDSTVANDVPGWDSLSNVLFLLDMEKRYGIFFSPQDITEMTSLGNFYNLLLVKAS